MQFLSTHSFTISTKLSPEELAERLKSNIRKPVLLSSLLLRVLPPDFPFEGFYHSGGFIIWRLSSIALTFRPIVYGKFETADSGIDIHVTQRLKTRARFTAVFNMVLLFLILAFSIGLLFVNTAAIAAVLCSLAALLMFVGFMELTFRTERKLQKQLLEDIFSD